MARTLIRCLLLTKKNSKIPFIAVHYSIGPHLQSNNGRMHHDEVIHQHISAGYIYQCLLYGAQHRSNKSVFECLLFAQGEDKKFSMKYGV